MQKLTHTDLWKLEEYARERNAFRTKVIAHKKTRTVHLGPHLRLVFEDRTTVQYQVQEMLRIERIYEPEGIQDELDAYNPLIPDGATLQLGIGGIPETREMLAYCAEKSIVSDIELIPIQKINEAYERMLKGDVKYRFVIDIATLAA